MKSEFMALAAAGKEAEWLKNLLLKIPLWVKLIAPISIRCDSVSTLAKAYNQMYNGKSRHLGVRHSMVRELIMNGMVSIEFVRFQQNLADRLTKGLARDLVINSAEGIGLKYLWGDWGHEVGNTGRIFESVGLRWIPTGKLFDSCTSKVDSEPPHGSNVDIPNIHACKQTLDVSAGTSINVQKEQSLDLSAVSTEVHQAAETVTTSNELDLLFGPLFDEYFNGENQVVLKSSAVTTTDASNKRQQPDSTSSTSTLATTVTANGNFDL
ncbi:hypothetical protein Tco_1361592 [Tanacetum coccineum]